MKTLHPRSLLLGLLFLAGGAFAQSNVTQSLPEWDKLTPQQREALIAPVRERWNSDVEQRPRMLEHAQRWNSMTPEQRKQAQSSLLALQGKTENPNRFTVVPGGQQVDPMSGKAFTVPSQVLDNQTGRFIEQPGAARAADLPAGMKRQIGTSNGRPVYEDEKGNRFVG